MVERRKDKAYIWFCVAISKVIFLHNPYFCNGSPVVKKVSKKYLKFNLKSKCYCLDKWLIRLLATLFKTWFYLTKVAEIWMSWHKHSESLWVAIYFFHQYATPESLYWWFHMNFQWFRQWHFPYYKLHYCCLPKQNRLQEKQYLP